MSEVVAVAEESPSEGARPERQRGRASRSLAALASLPHGLTWIGVALIAVGFTVLAFTWGRVAGLREVGLQAPYLVSGGAGGLATVIVGLAIVGIAAKRADAAERSRQLRELRDIMVVLAAHLEPESDR